MVNKRIKELEESIRIKELEIELNELNGGQSFDKSYYILIGFFIGGVTAAIIMAFVSSSLGGVF